MSLTLLGDDMLETLICSKCKRYLSAKPIRIDPNGGINCGRCSSVGDPVRLVSYFNKIADYILFKCINRYDGCSEILTVDQTILHEKKCQPNKYLCPFCAHGSAVLPSYMFLMHMKTEHKETCLLTNMFTVETIDSEKHEFFYKKGDYLFFIQQWFLKDRNCIVLNANFIGGDTNEFPDVYQKYYLVESTQLLNVKSHKCSHLADVSDKSSMQMVNIELNETNLQYVTIIFEFQIPSYENFIMNFDPTLSQSLLHRDIRNDYQNLLKKSLKHSMDLCVTSQCEYARILEIVHPNGKQFKNLSLNSTKTKLYIEVFDENSELQIKSICFHCIFCKRLLCMYTSPKNEYFLYGIETAKFMQYFVCSHCRQIISPYFDIKKISSVLLEHHFESIKFSCIRKCSNNEEILQGPEHSEKSCSLMKSNNCKSCYFSAEDFATLQHHFLTVHKSNLLNLDTKGYDIMFNKNDYHQPYHIFYWDKLIVLNVKFVNNEYWLSAEMCEKDFGDSHLLVALFQNGIYFGKMFYSSIKIDLDTTYGVKPIILEI